MSASARQKGSASVPARALPFGALRTVEAACRHRSFTLAARELFITHSAVSQAVRRLEAELGTVLFERRGTAIEPSQAAQALAASYRAAATTLHQALTCAADDVAAPVVLSTPAALGRWWLGRHLADLYRAFPEHRFEVRSNRSAGDTAEPDLIIHVAEPGDRTEPGMETRRLLDVSVYPVCAPALLEGRCDGGDLSTLPRVENLCIPWSLLDEATGDLRSPDAVMIVDDTDLAVRAALDGVGVVLGHDILVRDYLADGRLVMAASNLRKSALCSVSWRSDHRRRPLLAAVAEWLASRAPARH